MQSRLLLLSFLTLLGSFNALGTEIFVADISKTRSGITLTQMKNITNRVGYDNQPFFSNKHNGLYYTAMFENEKTTQTDTLFYDFTSGKTHNVTNTKNISEYSPTEMISGNSLSMIIVEPDGTQRLWATQLDNQNQLKKQSLINESIKPVGYHVWGKSNDLALFVLGEPMMLQYIKNPNQSEGEIIAGDIGRSLRYNQQKDFFTFSMTNKDKHQVLHQFDANKVDRIKAVKSLVQLPKDSEYYTWLNSNEILSASAQQIYFWRYTADVEQNKNNNNWKLFADVSEFCTTKVTRLAVNEQESKIAFVCDEQ